MLEMASRSVPSVLIGLYRRARPAIVGFSRPSTQQGRTSMALTLGEANRVLEATLAKAKQLNIKVSAAVVDAGGRLVAFQRMDNAIWASAYGSQGKGGAPPPLRPA